MTPAETLQELNTCFTDWSGFLVNKNTSLRGHIVAWPHFVPNIEKSISWDTVGSLASTRQYSFQLLDGSIIQMVYDFSSRGSQLKSAMLAYFENVEEQELDEETEGEILPIDDEVAADSPKWVRIDFSRGDQSSVIHTDCHLHLSGFPDTRIACAGVPGPRQFLESLLAWLYPTHYRTSVLDKVEERDLRLRAIDVNRVCLKLAPREHFNSLLHLTLPPSVRFPEGRVESR
jgi:hypothetical protein